MTVADAQIQMQQIQHMQGMSSHMQELQSFARPDQLAFPKGNVISHLNETSPHNSYNLGLNNFTQSPSYNYP